MRTVWKYVVPVDGKRHCLYIPAGSQLLHVGTQGKIDEVVLWIEIDDAASLSTRYFQVYGTGHQIPDNASYIGTTVVRGGDLVWHLYEFLW